MTDYLLDTFAWIEYFEGSISGKKVEALISDPANRIFTCSAMLAEVISKVERGGKDSSVAFEAIERLSQIIPVDTNIGRSAGSLHAAYRKKMKGFGLMDAFLLATGESLKATIVTGDEHFKKMENVEFLD